MAMEENAGKQMTGADSDYEWVGRASGSGENSMSFPG